MFKTLASSMLQKPLHITFIGEDKDETILYVLRRSFITNLGWILISIIAFFAPLFLNPYFYMLNKQVEQATPVGFFFIANAFWYLALFGYMFERFLNWFFNVYIISDKRILDMDFNSFLHCAISEAPLRNIEDITDHIVGTWQTIFNYGDVTIQTAAETREFNFEKVANPARVRDILSDLVSEIKNNGNS